ncbi:unnamed protein product [Urochloa humidicola]
MAGGKTSSPPSSFSSIMKEGAHLHARNRTLFVVVFALAAAYTSLLQLFEDLAVQPHADKVALDITAYNNSGTGRTRSPKERAQLLQVLEKDLWDLARPGAVYFLVDATIGSAVWIVVILAAVATCSDSGGSFGKAMAQFMGPALTVAFAYAVQIAYVAALLAAAAKLVSYSHILLVMKGVIPLLLLVCLLPVVAFHVYFTFLCVLSVVVAAAEPGRRGPGALARAWQLLKGRNRRFVKLLVVVASLTGICYRVHAMVRTHAHSIPLLELLLGFLYAVAVTAVKLFAVCTFTVFYDDCKVANDDTANTKLPQ